MLPFQYPFTGVLNVSYSTVCHALTQHVAMYRLVGWQVIELGQTATPSILGFTQSVYMVTWLSGWVIMFLLFIYLLFLLAHPQVSSPPYWADLKQGEAKPQSVPVYTPWCMMSREFSSHSRLHGECCYPMAAQWRVPCMNTHWWKEFLKEELLLAVSVLYIQPCWEGKRSSGISALDSRSARRTDFLLKR